MVVVMVIGIMLYHQHQLIKSYRSLLYGQLYIIQKPIERIILFQETGEQYTLEQRAQLFELLYDAFVDVANHTDGGLQMEPLLKNNILEDFNIKNEYLQCLNAYIETRTPEKREEAHLQLKEQYEAYQIFLKNSETN
ncbi:hypothetical protein AB1J28_09475 [Lysinibacillus irui]|uniref:hypothetical protein n=1 Tax=Lysinibacillus irui TaxID=2998077 RepID=UPI003D2A476D